MLQELRAEALWELGCFTGVPGATRDLVRGHSAGEFVLVRKGCLVRDPMVSNEGYIQFESGSPVSTATKKPNRQAGPTRLAPANQEINVKTTQNFISKFCL